MVATNTAWTPSATPGEAKGNTPAQPAKDGSPAVPEKPFTGRPAGVKWDAAKTPPKKAEAKAEVAEADAPEGMTAAERKIWKIKVNGQERDFDATDEAALRKMVEKAMGADEVFQKSAQTSKQAQQFFDMLREAAADPDKMAQLLANEAFGKADFDKLAEQRLWKKIQDEKMTPEQREARRIQEELAKYKAKEAKEAAEKEAKEKEGLVGEIQTSFTNNIQSAHKEVGLHTNPQSIYRMAEYARDAIEEGRDPDFKSIAARVKQDYMEEFIHYFENADPEQLKTLATEKVLKALRKMDVDRLKTTIPDQFKASGKSRTPIPKGQEPKKLDGADWRAKLIRERS